MAFRWLRRGLLLLIGTMGSFCVVCLLVHSGAALWQPPAGETTPGVRPMVTISLEEYSFTGGDGTRENPFR